uniref:Guanine nucleotide-binding protein subunit gamma n=1 Tax=Zosterops lateralis melanops TaxID=1220523 RepID=A0A8D2P2K0_ZOSLA
MHESSPACTFPDKGGMMRRSCRLPAPQVSQAAAELQQYCMQNACKDALLVGVPAGSNPFREPRSCTVL